MTRDDVLHRVGAGIALVPQGGRVFSNLTVRENLELGGYVVRDPGALAACLDLVYATFPRLQERAAPASGHAQRWRAPRDARDGTGALGGPQLLLMLDEPASRLAPPIPWCAS